MKEYVLIAEPEARLARTLMSIADEAQLESVVVRDGAEARKVIEHRSLPVLLITNLTLPRLDGFGLLEELRKIALPAQMPAMVISSSMQLRTVASQQRSALGIAEIAASGMTATALRAGIRRALASVGRQLPGEERSRVTRSLSPRAPSIAPSRDPARLARIEAMGLVDDQPPDAGLQRLVEQTARGFNVPIALVTLVLEHRQWFKAHVGIGGQMASDRGTPIDESFCRHVVDADTATPLIVPDATRHPLFSTNPHVMSGAVGSYAGAPLLTSDGKVLGTLCIVDSKPLAIGYDEVDELMALARRVAGELELKSYVVPPQGSASKRPPAGKHALEYMGPLLGALDAGVLMMDLERRVLHASAALGAMLHTSADELIGKSREWVVSRWCALSDSPEELMRRLRVSAEGPYVARDELELARPRRQVLRWTARPVRFPDGNAQLELYTDITQEKDATLDDLTLFVEDE